MMRVVMMREPLERRGQWYSRPNSHLQCNQRSRKPLCGSYAQ